MAEDQEQHLAKSFKVRLSCHLNERGWIREDSEACFLLDRVFLEMAVRDVNILVKQFKNSKK